MKLDTRDRLLDAARHHFAEKGFDGTSIAAIADELGLTKQALLHHFGSKEKLYGEVLRQISERALAGISQTEAESADPLTQLETLFVGHLSMQFDRLDDTRLLVRELLDNSGRAERAGNWYLKPFLDALVSIVRRVPGKKRRTRAEALAIAYQLLGAVNYFVISEPTLTQMFGKSDYESLKSRYPTEMRRLIRARLAPA